MPPTLTSAATNISCSCIRVIDLPPSTNVTSSYRLGYPLPPPQCPTRGMTIGTRSPMYALINYTYAHPTTDRVQDFSQIFSARPPHCQIISRRTQGPTPRAEQATMGCRRTTRTIILPRSKGRRSYQFRLQTPSQASVPQTYSTNRKPHGRPQSGRRGRQ